MSSVIWLGEVSTKKPGNDKTLKKNQPANSLVVSCCSVSPKIDPRTKLK
jgi:hypothetical protein